MSIIGKVKNFFKRNKNDSANKTRKNSKNTSNGSANELADASLGEVAGGQMKGNFKKPE